MPISIRRSTLCLLAVLLPCCALAAEDAALTHARALLAHTILIDGHNDLPWRIREDKNAQGDPAKYDLRGTVPGNTDLKRLKAGGLGGQFWSVFIPGEIGSGFAKMQLEQIEIARRVIERYPEAFQLALTADQVEAAHRNGRIASLLGIEGGHAIENSLGALDSYYRLGVRYMTLTHNVNLDWADSAAKPPQHNGLTDFGRRVVGEMNRLGMLVDLSHTAPETMRAALAAAQAPVIFSHSNARSLCDVPRNVPDDVLDSVKANGGVVMVTFVAGFVSPEVAKISQPAMDLAEQDRIRKEIFDALKLPKVTVAQVADHIDYIRKRIGVEHVGIGGDFDGNDEWPEGLSDVSMYPNLFAELIRRGWKDAELEQLAGRNVLRALRGAEATAARLQAAEAKR
jgi:membrane dipeptidase